jgi:hypothetical protein
MNYFYSVIYIIIILLLYKPLLFTHVKYSYLHIRIFLFSVQSSVLFVYVITFIWNDSATINKMSLLIYLIEYYFLSLCPLAFWFNYNFFTYITKKCNSHKKKIVFLLIIYYFTQTNNVVIFTPCVILIIIFVTLLVGRLIEQHKNDEDRLLDMLESWMLVLIGCHLVLIMSIKSSDFVWYYIN